MWAALERRQRETAEPIHHIVRAALAEYLQLSHSTLFQVSTSGALVEGIYKGAVDVARLRELGDFGIGTFEGLDGEMVAMEGRFYQVRSDSTVREADDGDLSPFAVVTWFEPERTIEIERCPDLDFLIRKLDSMRTLDSVHLRAMCRTEEGVPLVAAAADQPEFHLGKVEGAMVGFWSPDYVKNIDIPGYHLHFITKDRSAGGHLLGLSGSGLRIGLQQVTEMRVALPATEEFLRADLTRDPSGELEYAERARPLRERISSKSVRRP